MGGERYDVTIKRSEARTAKAAFEKAVKQAQYDHGHSGYSGTIAEKSRLHPPAHKPFETWEAARAFARDFGGEMDKWGPSEVVEVKGKDGGWLFFGWASS